jgi:hypothetical protein
VREGGMQERCWRWMSGMHVYAILSRHFPFLPFPPHPPGAAWRRPADPSFCLSLSVCLHVISAPLRRMCVGIAKGVRPIFFTFCLLPVPRRAGREIPFPRPAFWLLAFGFFKRKGGRMPLFASRLSTRPTKHTIRLLGCPCDLISHQYESVLHPHAHVQNHDNQKMNAALRATPRAGK